MSRKLLLDPYLAIHGKIMAKKAIFSWNFDLFLTFFIDCGHIYVPKLKTWGSTSSPHIGDKMMSLFSLWGQQFMTEDEDGLKMVHFGPKMAKHGRLCLLYTSPSPRDLMRSRMPSSA